MPMLSLYKITGCEFNSKKNRKTMHPRIIEIPRSDDLLRHIEGYVQEKIAVSYPQLHIAPAGQAIAIDQIRALKKELRYAGMPKMIIFHLFERSTVEAQNALLKVLEELGDRHVFLLFTCQIEIILPTIRSRCIVEKHGETQLYTPDPLLVRALEGIAGGSRAAFSSPLFQPAGRDEALLLFTQILYALRDKIRTGDTSALNAAKKALVIRSLLDRNNLNPQLAIDQWLLFVLS